MPLNPYAKEWVPGGFLAQMQAPVQQAAVPQPGPAQATPAAEGGSVAQLPVPKVASPDMLELEEAELFQAPPSPTSHLEEGSRGGLQQDDGSGSSLSSSPSAQGPCEMPPGCASQAEQEPPGQPSTVRLPQKVGPSDFELLRVVGQGSFGKVFQVRKKDTGHIYAMKVMRKEKILEKDHGQYVKQERDVLTAVFHPYIVTLRYSFQTNSKLYLLLDFINGGHLFFQLYRQGIFDEALTRLYTAEIVLAIAHLHSLGFVHRDLKPENVLLDSQGHIKVTDFGLAKGNMEDGQRTNSFIGTMEYMAPEIISGTGHQKTVDWWSVGILMYEMLCGVPPFNAKGRNQLQKQILGGKLKLPGYLSSQSQSLLRGLLVRDPAKRLGSGPDGSQKIMDHPFFNKIDWESLKLCQVLSPFKPDLKDNQSVENFDKMWTDQKPSDSPANSPAVSNLADIFAGYSYTAGFIAPQ